MATTDYPAPNKNGYIMSEVAGSDFRIKEGQPGTESERVGRRLARRSDVRSVDVEYDGSVKVQIWAAEPLEFNPSGSSSYDNLLPDGWTIREVMLHPTEMNHSAAHVTMEPGD